MIRQYFRLLVANARENAAIGNYYELRNYYLELPEDLIRGNPVLMMGMSLLQSILMNVDESERWYHELEEYQKQAEGSDAREAKGRLITLDISLPHRGISGMTDLLRAAGVLITDRKVHIPGTLCNQQSSLDDEWRKRLLRVEPQGQRTGRKPWKDHRICAWKVRKRAGSAGTGRKLSGKRTG